MPNFVSVQFDDIISSEVYFIERLKLCKYSATFYVNIRGTEYVMKVYYGRARAYYDNPNREISLFKRESNAYQRLKAHGFCQRGLISDFYGTITDIQPALWPCLEVFIDDKLPPSAVLIEYIPGMQQFDLTNFSEERMSTLSRALEEMHQVGVIHGDPMPRNMMIQTLSEGRERILWIDFDSSMTFPENVELTPRQATWVREEVEMVDYFAKAMAQDSKRGKLKLAYSYYYDWFGPPGVSPPSPPDSQPA